MTIVIPIGRGVSLGEEMSVMVMSAIVGALFGAVIAAVVFVKAILYLLWFIMTWCKRLVFG
jgi:hypothetical protein